LGLGEDRGTDISLASGSGNIISTGPYYDPWAVCIIVLLTGCFCIGPGIDSRSAVLADLESIPGPIQKQPVNNTFIK